MTGQTPFPARIEGDILHPDKFEPQVHVLFDGAFRHQSASGAGRGELQQRFKFVGTYRRLQSQAFGPERLIHDSPNAKGLVRYGQSQFSQLPKAETDPRGRWMAVLDRQDDGFGGSGQDGDLRIRLNAKAARNVAVVTRRAGAPAKSSFVVGFLTGYEFDWLNAVRGVMRDERPSTEVVILSLASQDLADGLVRGKIDLAFLRPEKHAPGGRVQNASRRAADRPHAGEISSGRARRRQSRRPR